MNQIILNWFQDIGILTDSQGRRVDFKNTGLIMTSNIGSSVIESAKTVGFSASSENEEQKSLRDRTMAELKKFFRPEFLNRIDEMILFNRLTPKDVTAIAHLFLRQLQERVEKLRIRLEFDDSVAELVVRKGYDINNGARHLRRAITQYVENALSEAILSHRVEYGTAVRVFAEEEKIVFQLKND